MLLMAILSVVVYTDPVYENRQLLTLLLPYDILFWVSIRSSFMTKYDVSLMCIRVGEEINLSYVGEDRFVDRRLPAR